MLAALSADSLYADDIMLLSHKFESGILIMYRNTVSQKIAPLRQVGINSAIFNTKKIRNIRFIGNFILNKSCEFYDDDVTMTSFIGNKLGDVAAECAP